MERMSRSKHAASAASPNRTPISRRSGRGLGRNQPRARLEWEFGQDARESLPAPRTGRQNGKPPRQDAAVPPADPRPRALQGDVLPAAPVTRADNRYAPPNRSGRTPVNPTANPPVSPTLVSLFQGENGLRRAMATRIALDEAIDRWWTNADLADLPLLRDGLLLLEAGHDLDETQRSFLLRSALRAQRGLLTALRHQTDPDRTAFLLKDALLDLYHPLPPQLLSQLRSEDHHSDEWVDYLEHDLAYEANAATGRRSQLAAAALATLVGKPLTTLPRHRPRLMAAPTAALTPLSHRWSLRWLCWLLVTLLLIIVYGWGEYRTGTAMVAIPAGAYVISDPASSTSPASPSQRTVTLAAYAIDRTEVTNRAYRRCVAAGACLAPTEVASQMRLDYFTNPAYDEFPVVNVDWDRAQQYCGWLGKTLPSLEQWEVAAAIAPATQRRFSYPWGERFEARFANSAVMSRGDTQAAGAYQPAGNSQSGVADLAGNVAEWTAMPAARVLDGYLVKGGSFQDDAAALRTDAFQEVAKATAVPWLGFRCVRAQ